MLAPPAPQSVHHLPIDRDGVGLGKGRQLAGIILDNWNQGRKRHLWVSVSADLMQDATNPRPHPLTLTLSP